MSNKDNIETVTRKFAIIKQNAIKSISLSLATPEDILEWSNGEVILPETINYKTFKPEDGGLFDEVIFGPTTDYKCPVCSTKYKRSNEGQICEKTDNCKLKQPSILAKSSRRSRMGHISLASPVVHHWFFKVDHSSLSKLLGLRIGGKKMVSKSALESVIYFKSHIVLDSGGIKALPQNLIINIDTAAIVYRDALKEILTKHASGSAAHEEIFTAIEELEELASSKIGKDYGIDFYELNDIISEYSNAVILTGARAIESLLKNFNLKKEISLVKRKINEISKNVSSQEVMTRSTTKLVEREKLYKRLKVLEEFKESKQDPLNMLITELPVIPADLRPLIQLDGGRHSTTDVNELYRRIVIRNNRLKKWNELEAPILIVQNEMRMLQEAVDALIDNARKKPNPVMSKDNRPLKSIADALTGKKGRFRQNLLGKRVDYSGRSVIVVGTQLKMHQAGISRQMAAKLFEPWIVRELILQNIAPSIKMAKKLIDDQKPVIWPHVETAIKGKTILLNRAPTLHRLSIQAFEPVLVRGRVIKLHPLVTTAFNADFDGDQMAVHVPISEAAQREARELMLANKNILGPKDGEPIINPSQDMILGLYYLTAEFKGVEGEGNYYNSIDDVIKAYESKDVSPHARIAIPAKNLNKENILQSSINGYVVTSVGKLIFNQSFPKNFNYVFDNSEETLTGIPNKFILEPGTDIRKAISDMPLLSPFDKKDIQRIIRSVYDKYVATISKKDMASVIAKLNPSNFTDLMIWSEVVNNDGSQISPLHAKNILTFSKIAFEKVNERVKARNEGIDRFLEPEERAEILEEVWFNYTNIVASVLDNIKDLGFKYSMLSGSSISISDIKTSDVKNKEVKNAEKYIKELKEFTNDGYITDDERYRRTIAKWATVKDIVQNDLKNKVKHNPQNSVFMMMESGARGNISNFVQLAGMRGLMANNAKALKAHVQQAILIRSTIEVPVKSSFLEGLSEFEFYSSTHGARKGLTDTALNTAKSGYLTRKLVDVAQNITIKEQDCGSDHGFVVLSIMDTKTNTVIVPLMDRIQGRFSNVDILDSKGQIIAEHNTLITKEIAEKIIAAKIEKVNIRSILGCATKNGACQKCYGVDLSTNKIVSIGEAVGIIAAQSIGEPGTQLTMRTFHTGGVAGVEDITGGFSRLIELIDAHAKPWGTPAIISKSKGKITDIITDDEGKSFIKMNTLDNKGKEIKERVYEFSLKRKLRVKKGDMVVPGQKIVDGPIILKELLEYADVRAVQHYLIKELQRLYRMQGINIQDKYIEIIVRQMHSKLVVSDPGDSTLFHIGETIDINTYKTENAKLLSKGKKPSYGIVMIKGVKHAPLLSDSFLAAASYQETAKILMHASMAGKKDTLEGIKENVLVGHRIPAGTGANFEKNAKFDLRDSTTYFKSSKK